VQAQLVVQQSRNEEWIVRRRFSRFDELDVALKTRFPRLSAHLPSKRGLKRIFLSESQFSREFIEHRAQKLDEYLGQLVHDPYARDSPELARFLMEDRILVEEDSVLSHAQDDSLVVAGVGGAAGGAGGEKTLLWGHLTSGSHRKLVDVERNLYSLLDVFLMLVRASKARRGLMCRLARGRAGEGPVLLPARAHRGLGTHHRQDLVQGEDL
jgi:hypothetical protein